jgi:hypothetical protein
MKKVILLACLCCTLFSCEDVEKKAGEKLQAAREAFELGNYNEAKILIDSIKMLYPKAFETRRAGSGTERAGKEPGLSGQYASSQAKGFRCNQREIHL